MIEDLMKQSLSSLGWVNILSLR